MTKAFYLLNFLFCFFFAACNDDLPQYEEKSFLLLNESTLLFDETGGEKTLSVFSNTSWAITGANEWCHLSANSGSDSLKVVITVDPNQSKEERVCELLFETDQVENTKVSVSQKAFSQIEEEEELSNDYPDMRQISSLELSKLMGIGWNVGNSLEALLSQNGVFSGNETSWGNAKISQQLIDSVKAAGFNTVRVPVSWSHKLIDKDTYTIDPEWLSRVEEVVGYIVSNQMYAIINIHWDGGWMDHPFYNKQAEINNKIEALWIQIAEHFIEYNDYLLFAGTNEVHVENNWNAPSKENAEVQNSFNQTFVDAVRLTGARNKLRHLVIQGYNTNIDHTIKHFVLPSDVVESKLMVEVHFYDPYDFALQEDSNFKTQWGAPFAGGDVPNWGQESWVNEAFLKMKTKFVNNNIPVVLGEYGALLRTNLQSGQQEHIDARNYYLEYVTNAALENGIVPVYWDNGYAGNNGFGLFKRSNGSSVYPDAIHSIMKRNK
ncbi:MAG TPA: cellulase family glycosylhydrolase [Prolixibacteraceae bacterium]|nr:cellulase family glycosylhydrolase [Prolixibacteraceae bacterium]